MVKTPVVVFFGHPKWNTVNYYVTEKLYISGKKNAKLVPGTKLFCGEN